MTRGVYTVKKPDYVVKTNKYQSRPKPRKEQTNGKQKVP